jgi:hypothetical protein
VLSHAAFDEFYSPFRTLEYAIVCTDRSEFTQQMLALAAFQATFRLTMRPRQSAEFEMNSMDNATLLHHELTLFCPMLPAQLEQYKAAIVKKIGVLSQPPEIVARLASIAGFPAVADCSKIGVLSAIVKRSHAAEQRLMLLCRQVALLDSLELYFQSSRIRFARMVGRLGTKRPRLEDLSPDSKWNKKVAILGQFQRQPQNWLSLAVDIVINSDGVHHFMHYFAHPPGRAKRRTCLVVRLLTADSHDAAQSVNHALTHYEIIRAAARARRGATPAPGSSPIEPAFREGMARV